MKRFFLKYRLILWKHFLLWKRHPIATILLVLFPILPVICLAYLRGVVDLFETTNIENSTVFPESSLNYCNDFKILYSPDSESAMKMMDKVKSKLSKADITKCEDEEDMKVKLVALKEQAYYAYLFGIVFESLPMDLNQTQDFSYKIRPAQYYWHTDELRPDTQFSGPMEISDFYNDWCFTNLQIALDESFLQLSSQSNVKLNFLFQKFPYPPYVADPGLMTLLTTYVSLVINFGYFILAFSIIKKIIEEKNSGAKELMRMMGMSSEMQTLGWFSSYMILVTVELIAIIIILACGVEGDPILKESDKLLSFVFLLFYCVSYLCLTIFLASVFASEWKATIALVVVSILPSYILDAVKPKDMGLFPSMLLCLIPEIGIQKGFGIIGIFESGGSGSQWSNLWTKPRGRVNELSLGIVFILLILSSVISLVLAWYMDKVHPGKYGLARPWYFPFAGIYRKLSQKSKERYCTGENARLADNLGKPGSRDANKIGRFEQLPPGKSVGIKIKGVKKYFEGGHIFQSGAIKKAVDGVSLDILDGEITALLGHNGAGKTTLINILTGLYSATEGHIIMGGYDIEKDIDSIRENLGLCPQHSLLFPELTVWEHLIFFAMCKGASYKIAQMESEDFIKMLKLEEKKNTIAKSLSGGMKRKLSVGIAFVGKSKILILDEPTTGMDPESRRQMWDLLLSLRRQRCILLTTHYMQEADVLGDRIAIMDHGQVKCHGTSLFLKKIFGTGYHLTMLFGDPKNNSSKQEVTDLVKQKVPGATTEQSVGSELNFTLPTDTVDSFPALFSELDSKKDELDISGVSVSITTLEEVFLEVGKLDESKIRTDSRELVCEIDSSRSLIGNNAKVTGWHLSMQQAGALFLKKLLFARTIWIQILGQSLFAVCLLVTVLESTEKTFSLDSEPPFTFSISDYGNTYAFTFGNGEFGEKAQNIYQELLFEKGSIVDKIPWDNVTDNLLEAGKQNLAAYRDSYVVSASFDASSVSAYYSTTLRHSCPTSVNLITTTLLRLLTNSNKSIVTTVHPFPDKSVNTIFSDIHTTTSNLVFWLMFPHLGLMIMLCLFIILPILEGTNGARNLQLMALSPNISIYWIVSLCFDMAIYMTNIFISLIIYLIISPGSYYRSDFYGALILLLFLFGLCSIPFIYLISYFKDTIGGGVSSTCIVFLVGMALGVTVAVMGMFSDLSHVSTPLHIIGLLFPSVPFTVGIRKFYITSVYNSKCDAIPYTFRKDLCSTLEKAISSIDMSCCDNICKEFGNCFKPYSYFNLGSFIPSNDTTILDPEGMGVDFSCLAALLPFYLGILYLIDKGIFASIVERILEILTVTFRKDFATKVAVNYQDEDVCKETDRMDFTLQSECKQEGKDILKVHKLKKNYGWFRWIRGGHQAVRGVTFGVDPGDCFGLLGANGAGKTSTFQMITGTFPSSSGKSYVLDEASHGWTGKNTKYQAHVGYCPQFDGVVNALSGRQMLSLYASLQGIPKESVNKEVQHWLNNLDLNEPADRACRAYSGGNLRRLSTAMALIGNHPLVCLDEPTAGVDPVARRGMWNVLKCAQSTGSALVLTSHSMEECEALCTKLAIMLNGQFVCIGEVPYLKQKYGQGFTLLIKLNVTADPGENASSNLAKLKEDIERKFHPCIIKDEHQGLIHYQIMNPETKWGYMFSSMEELKRMYHPYIEDYSLSETSLEQVFISFAKQQEGDE